MWWLFEKLVARLLHEVDPAWDGQQSFTLDTGGALTIRPDLLLRGNDGPLAVADTKYKLLDDQGKVSNGDVFQMLAYCARFGLDRGHLVYAGPAGERDSLSIRGTGTTIHVHAIDITAPVPHIEQQARDLAQRLAGEEPVGTMGLAYRVPASPLV